MKVMINYIIYGKLIAKNTCNFKKVKTNDKKFLLDIYNEFSKTNETNITIHMTIVSYICTENFEKIFKIDDLGIFE